VQGSIYDICADIGLSCIGRSIGGKNKLLSKCMALPNSNCDDDTFV
jgi:hypothetical protein